MGDLVPGKTKVVVDVAGHKVHYDDKRHTYTVVTPAGASMKVPSASGVTKAVDLGKSRALTWWAAGLGADRAMEVLERFKDEDTEKIVLDASLLPDLHKAIRTAHNTRLDEAADIGKLVHAEIETWLEGGPEGSTHGFAEFKDWAERAGIEREGSLCERIIYNPVAKYAGTFDIIATMSGQGGVRGRWLIDIKTSNAIRKENPLQLAAYVAAVHFRFPEERLVGACICRVPKAYDDGSIEVVYYDEDEMVRHYDAFLAAKRIMDWEAGL